MLRSALVGICEALIAKKLQYTPFTNKRKFSLEIHAIVSFCELLYNPLRKVIDLQKVPQDLRSRLYSNLDKFGNGIQTLILGSGSGGMVPERYSETILRGKLKNTHMRI